MTDIAATNEAEVVDAVRAARDWKSPLNIVGARTKRNFGRAVASWGTGLDLSGLRGVIAYEPDELTLTVKPGTPVAEINALLAEKNQWLGFEPADWGQMLSAAAGRGTIGGAIAADTSGSAAVRYGRARDSLLGIRAVNGLGEAYKAGGKVVKNVTGFDLPLRQWQGRDHQSGRPRDQECDRLRSAQADVRRDGHAWSAHGDDAAGVSEAGIFRRADYSRCCARRRFRGAPPCVVEPA
jgi:hypothetical protein